MATVRAPDQFETGLLPRKFVRGMESQIFDFYSFEFAVLIQIFLEVLSHYAIDHTGSGILPAYPLARSGRLFEEFTKEDQKTKKGRPHNVCNLL